MNSPTPPDPRDLMDTATPYLKLVRDVPPMSQEETVSRLYNAWTAAPTLRFGQLIENARQKAGLVDLFYIEDKTLVEIVETFVGPPN